LFKFLLRVLLPILVLISVGTAVSAKSPVTGMFNGQTPSARRAGMRVYESDRGKQLLGEVIQADFPRLLPGWDQELETYVPGAEDIAILSDIQEDISIICVLGTWCGDSEREVPRFWKILQETDNAHLEMTMFSVGRSKDEKARSILDNIGFDEPLREIYDVQLVPTFIFMSGETELGRIVETPEGTLEQDAAQILSPDAGKPAWH